MPKIPGRQTTRVTLDLEHIEVLSFVFSYEKYAFNKRCCVTGCEHLVSGVRRDKVDDTKNNPYWAQCDDKTDSVGAAVVADKRITDRRGNRGLMICPCCLEQLDEAWRAANGDPE